MTDKYLYKGSEWSMKLVEKQLYELQGKVDCLEGRHKSGAVNDIPGTNIFRCLRCNKQFIDWSI